MLVTLRAVAATSAVFIVSAAAAAPPALDQRLASAKEIRAQSWYTTTASLLDDVLWSRQGALIFRDRVRGEYQVLDEDGWKLTPLLSFEKLQQMLRQTDGIDATTLAVDVTAPLVFKGSGVVVRNAGTEWFCEIEADVCSRHRAEPLDGRGVNLAPGGRVGLFLENSNVHLLSSNQPEAVRLTTDGGTRITYGSVASDARGAVPPPKVAWSDDGRYAIVSRADASQLGEASLVEWLPEGKFGARAKVTSIPKTFFGDPHALKRTLYVVDTLARRIDPIPDSTVADGTGDPVSGGFVQFSHDNRHAYYIRPSADFRSARLVEVDLSTRVSRTVLTETSPEGGFLYFSGNRNPAAFRVLSQRNAVIWYSERDGFGHLYQFALDSGKLVKQLTRGEWTVLTIERVAGNKLYLTGTSPAGSREPYERQLYVLDIRTGRVEQRTEAGADHAFAWSATGDLVVQSAASIDMPPALRIVSTSGARAPLTIGISPATALAGMQATGFRIPERFHVTSKVAGRAVFGTIHFPSWMRPDDRLPIIEKIYPGYCCVIAPWAFPHERLGRNSLLRFFEPQALAELGFVVVITAGPGSPLRGRAYHQAQYADGFWDPDNLDTHIDVLEQLAANHPQMNLGRVGIYGHSGGGYAAARAILLRPQFYQVAVAMSGNHDRRLYDALWPVLYAGHDPNGPTALAGPETVSLARNLKGNLLLMHGDADDSVLIDSTMQLAAALQREHKKFDMQVIVGAAHGIDVNEFTREYYSSFFLEHLRGESTEIDLAGRSR